MISGGGVEAGVAGTGVAGVVFSLGVEVGGGKLVARLIRQRSASGFLPSVDPMLASVLEASRREDLVQ